MVFLHLARHGATDVLQAARQAVGASLRGGTIELPQLWFRHTYVRAKDIPKDKPLERGVVGHDLMAGNVGERLTRQPGKHLAIIESVGHAQHLGAGILRVVVDAATG